LDENHNKKPLLYNGKMNFFYFQIAVPIPIREVFTYKSSQMLPKGARVQISFGSKTLIGIVIEQLKSKPTYEVKEVSKIFENKPIFESNIFNCLIWASKYYHHPIGEVFQTFTPNLLRNDKKSLPNIEDSSINDYKVNESDMHQSLTASQTKAIKNINTDKEFNISLLHGVTGSGKTEVYLNLVSNIINKNQAALILVPEINLTPQLHKVFSTRFNGEIGLYHSKQTPLQRFKVWSKARSGNIRIVIGTRSAIMNPILNLGLIIIDEEHDQSFKQSEGFKFSAREMGIKRAQKESIPILLGSATPSLSVLKLVEENKITKINMSERVDGRKPPSLIILDINNKKLTSGIAQESLEAIDKTLKENKQVLIFINRRGFAPMLQCNSCGWTAECSACESNLVYHKERNRLICHRCESAYGKPELCPNCASGQIELLGLGTEKVEDYLARTFPDVNTIRIDQDSTKKKNSMNEIYEQLNNSGPAILVGTQMLAKGHDFNNVALTLVINADNGLISPEINALEKVSQLLIQVSGRAGRKSNDPKVIIQTRYPQDKTLNQIRNGDYLSFANKKLAENKASSLPPYSCASVLRSTSPTQQNNINFLLKVESLLKGKKNIITLGPLPSFVAKTKGSYKHSLYVQTSNRAYLNRVLAFLANEISGLKESKKVRWSFDIDPIDFS
jgi:primosomal protein N' (replication factor Y)